MDFGILPPEVNSGRMYSGPGPGPVLAAAAAWSALAAELELTASSYQSMITQLATGWSGPSATTMAAAATPYVTWMQGAAALAEQTAAQAYAAAAAFEAAFATTVPPPVIAANRSLLLALTATNFFGQNMPAIAANEAAYAEMWAQDAAAMYGYAGDAAFATTLTPFSPPPETTNPAGPADQVAAIGRAAGTATATKTQQTLAKLSSTMHGLAPPAADPSPTAALGGIAPPLSELPTNSVIELSLIPIHLGVDLFGAVVIDGLGVFAIDAPGAVGSMLLKDIAAAGGVPYVLAGASSPGAAPVSASMGHAVPVSGLSVPKAWTTAAGEPGPGVTAQPATDARATSTLLTSTPRHSPSQMAMAPMAGLGVTAGLNADRRGAGTPTGRRIKSPQKPRNPQLELAGELRELTDLHDAGILSDQEFAKERARLFGG